MKKDKTNTESLVEELKVEMADYIKSTESVDVWDGVYQCIKLIEKKLNGNKVTEIKA